MIFVFSLYTLGQVRLDWVAPLTPSNTYFSSAISDDKIFFYGEATTLYSSSNTGDTWDNLSSKFNFISEYTNISKSTNNLSFVNDGYGYLSDHESIYKTIDNGITWKKIASVFPYELTIIHFNDKNNGWISRPFPYRSTNGGSTWIPMSGIQEGDGFIAGFRSLNKDRVWLFTVYNYESKSGGGIKYSSDGGMTWNDQNTGFTSNVNRQFSVVDLQMQESGLGIASIMSQVGNEYGMSCFLIRTTDFGVTWNYARSTEGYYPSLVSMSDSLWIVVGNNIYGVKGVNFQTSILRSSDFGVTWENILFDQSILAPRTAQWLSKEKVIIAGGYRGVMYQSKDFGLTWDEISIRQPIISSMSFYNRTSNTDFGIGVGNQGFLITSTNSGKTWNKSSISQALQYSLYSQSMLGNTILVGGSHKALFKSTDFGDSWVRIKTNLDNISIQSGISILDLKMINEQHWITLASPSQYDNLQRYIYDPSFVMITTDAGATWNDIQLPKLYQARHLSVMDQNNFFIAGDNFTQDGSGNFCFISKTTDGGITWQTINLKWYIQSLVMFDSSLGLAGGGYGMYRTTDGWKSWEKVYSSEYYGVDDIVFINDLEGFALSDLKIVRTTDGGKTWQDSSYIIPSNQIPVSLACNYENDLFVGSHGGGFFATINSKLITGTENNYVRTDVPHQYLLSQNYPNPFNPTTVINYSVPKQSNIKLTIYDALGREVANLVDEEKSVGNYMAEFDAANLSSGIYFYQLRAGEFVQMKKMILLR